MATNFSPNFLSKKESGTELRSINSPISLRKDGISAD